ncbi:MAG: ABC transporter ATP-binding protein [Candidatus Methanofastidiosia archaeon]
MPEIMRSSHLVKIYRNGVVGVDDISFNFEEGILGLIGPNGAGKSTLIKLAVGLITPTKGEAYLFGKKVKIQNPPLENIGILHEKPSYHAHITIRQYLRHVSIFINADERDIAAACDMLDVTPYIDRKIGTLSAGMRQKFGLTDAILGFPKLVILDEPTSNLDPLNRKKVLEIIKELSLEYGINFLISTHILGELEKVCDSVMILNRGKLLLHKNLTDLNDNYFPLRYHLKLRGAKKDDFTDIAKDVKETRPSEFIIMPKDPTNFKTQLFERLSEKRLAPDEFKELSPSLEEIFENALISQKTET